MQSSFFPPSRYFSSLYVICRSSDLLIPGRPHGEHGVLRMTAPWAREGSRFTLLFEQAALMLVREMPVLAAARIIEITDKRLWRIVERYVARAVERLDLSKLAAVGPDETAAKRGHTYVSVFIDLDRSEQPVVFVTRDAANKRWSSFALSWPNMAARPAASLRWSAI
jgi:Helix-turn-helix domain of transposase family ISL3